MRPRTGLAAFAHIGTATGGHDLADHGAAARARLACAAVNQEAVLKGAAGPIDVTEIVDRGALGVDPRLQRLLDPGPQPLQLGPRQATGGPERMDARPEKRFIGVDVADARDPPLVQHERLDRRPAAAREPE